MVSWKLYCTIVRMQLQRFLWQVSRGLIDLIGQSSSRPNVFMCRNKTLGFQGHKEGEIIMNPE